MKQSELNKQIAAAKKQQEQRQVARKKEDSLPGLPGLGNKTIIVKVDKQDFPTRQKLAFSNSRPKSRAKYLQL